MCDVQATEGIDSSGHCGPACRGVCHVGVHEQPPQLLGDGLASGVVDIRQYDASALTREMPGHALADAVASPRDECDLACDVHEEDRRGGESREISRAGERERETVDDAQVLDGPGSSRRKAAGGRVDLRLR